MVLAQECSRLDRRVPKDKRPNQSATKPIRAYDGLESKH